MKDLAGMFVIRYDDDGCFQTGRIIAQTTAEHFLVSFTRNVGGAAPEPLPMALQSLMDLTDRLEDGRAVYEFFDSEEARDAWADWLLAPTTADDAPLPAKAKRH
jgi:hypothetical protein